MKKDIEKFCNKFDCKNNIKALCATQKLMGKKSNCLYYQKITDK